MNKNKKYKLIIVAAVLICVILGRISVFTKALNEAPPEKIAVTLVIDTSGSMATTDPKKLRETAANIFIDLLSPDDYLSIITFNTKEEVVLPMQQIKSSENKAAFKSTLSQKLNAAGDTDYLGAFNMASNQFSSINEGNVRKVILFLTDGEPDPGNIKKNNTAAMNEYMDSLWKAVSNLALNKYAVYSVGFSKGIKSSVLEKISSNTQGTLKITDDSSELALSLFDILGTLKNSKGFLNKNLELKGSSSLEFDLDEYTSQATMVFTNLDGTPFDVSLSAPDGKSVKNVVTVNKSDKYNIVTLNQKNEKLTGKWKVELKGNGRIQAFGNKDLFVKPWLVSPEFGSLHPLNEPLDISVNVTGEVKDNISIEATVTKEGVQDKIPVKLENIDGVFKGTYKKVDKVGKYEIETRLMLNGEVITKSNTSFFVRELPSITTDFLQKDKAYRLGENLVIKSSLAMPGNKDFKSSEVKIDNYNLILNYTNSGTETRSLLDNGSGENGDVKPNDGVWSSKVILNKEGGGKASLIVNGTYKGEKFLLEKSLGNFNVYPPGKLLIKTLNSNPNAYNEIKIPIEIENTSNFTETMIISVDKAIGKLHQDRIKIAPLKKVKTYVYVKLDKNVEKKAYDIKVKLNAEDARTKVEPAEFTTKVQVISKTTYLLKGILIPILMFLVSFAAILSLIILLGLLLYRLLVYKNTRVQGKLYYWKESDLEGKDKKKFYLSKLEKDIIIISFNKENNNAEYHIFHDEYKYDIELIAIVEKSRWKFLDGYKAFFRKSYSSELLLKTTEPGIFIYEDKVYTSKKIYKNDKFTTGGYVFQYTIKESGKSSDKDKGKNVLKEL